MKLYLCDYLNPKFRLIPSDPRWMVTESLSGERSRRISFELELDESIPFDTDSVTAEYREVRMWKLGITKQKSPKMRSSFYVDTLVWTEIPDERDCRNLESILKSLTGPFFGNKSDRNVKVISEWMVSYPMNWCGGQDLITGGEWLSYRIPAHIVKRFVEHELDFFSVNGSQAVQARKDFTVFYSENYWAHLWSPPSLDECKSELEREWLAEFEEKRIAYPKMVDDWWATRGEAAVPRDDMWF